MVREPVKRRTPYHHGRTATIALPEPDSGRLRGGPQAERLDGEERCVGDARGGDGSAPPSCAVDHATIAAQTSRSAARNASIAESSAPPDVTTSSTTQRAPGLVNALQPVAGAVLLGLLAHDHERAARSRSTSPPRAAPRPAPGPASRSASRRVLAHERGQLAAEARQERRDRSRSGTCPGSSGCAGPSAARSRPRGTPAPPACGRARPGRTGSPGLRQQVAGDREQAVGVGRPGREREHRAVVEVEVDARAAAGAAAAVEDRARERAGAEQRRRPRGAA